MFQKVKIKEFIFSQKKRNVFIIDLKNKSIE